MPYTQANRLLSIQTPLGGDALLLRSFTGNEGISRLFRFHLDLLSENSAISFRDVVGQNVTLRVTLADDSERYFNGFVSRFAQSGSDVRFVRYQMEVVPWLWFLTRNADCRIFQNMTVPDILQKVFKDRGFHDFKSNLNASYEKRDYCVQYRETDFNFVSRLMEQYGIFYYFQHENGKHNLVLADSASAIQDCPGQSSAHYNAMGGADAHGEDVITTWQVEQELRTGQYSLTDYNFETPSSSLLAAEATVVDVGGNSAFEIYDYPGDHLTPSQGTLVAKLRMQEEEATHKIVSGSSTCRSFSTGYKFSLEDHYRDDMNDSYVLTEIQHVASAQENYGINQNGSGGVQYLNTFACIPAAVPFRPLRLTPKPFVQGPQTALVVGKSGEDIWVDKYGRIKVQFYWDRQGKRDENSSCWIRVSQLWAGKNWGGMCIPRIGQEVVVDFLEGDPDRPLITGRVYNAEETVPYELPHHHTVSTLKSRSSKGGSSENFNEIRFEDKMGSEQIFINAEKDMDQRVEHDLREYVNNDRHVIVHNNQHELVEADKHGHVKGKQNEAIDGNMSLKVGGDVKEQVGGGVSLQVSQSRNEKVGQTWAAEAGQTVHIKAGMTLILEAGMQLSLKGPGGFVDIGPAGVTIQGTMVLINSGGAAGAGPGASPQAPDAPKDPDTADDGTKFGKM